MGRIIKWVIVLAVLGGGVYGLRITVFVPKPVPVRLHRLGRGLVERTVTNSRAGTVKTRLRSQLSPEVSGRIIEIPFREGETVRERDVLVRLDPRSALATLNVAETGLETALAQLEEVRARLDQVVRELERKSNLLKDGATSEEIVDDYRSRRLVLLAAVAAAEKRVEGAKAAVEQAQAEKAKTEVRAPFAGVISKVHGEVGELSSPFGATADLGITSGPVIEIVNLDRLYVLAEIDEVDMGRLEVGLPVRVSLDPYPDTDFPGRIVRVAPTVSDLQEKNRTVEIEVEFDREEDAKGKLPGTSADVEVVLESRDGVLRIPAHAILEGDRVLLLEGGFLRARELEVGLRNWDFVEVISGLSVGDPVVVSLDREEIEEGAMAQEDEESEE